MQTIRIGTRGSRLALKQAQLVQEALKRADGQVRTELVILHTKGDKILDKPLAEIGDKGLFVSEFEQALLEDRIDLAVHSAKDLPMRLAEGLSIAAVLPRAEVRDVLVVRKGGRLPEGFEEEETAEGAGDKAGWQSRSDDENNLPKGTDPPFLVGTGSRRRQLLAEQNWRNVTCKLLRGNVETRLGKLAEGSYDGIILAGAGLDRLEISGRTEERFDFYPLCAKQFLPAACQGIIAVEARAHFACEGLLGRISDPDTALVFWVEQEVLKCLEAGCSGAAAAWCRKEGDRLLLDVMYQGKRAFVSGRAAKQDGLILAEKAAEMVKESEA